MKKLFFLFVCAAIAAACSSEMEVPSPANPDDEMVEVSFNLAGDYVSVEETPMTRADEGKTLYGIEIGSKIGLFSDIRNARIKLKGNTRYDVEICVIKEREDTLKHINGGYTDPFIVQQWGNTATRPNLDEKGYDIMLTNSFENYDFEPNLKMFFSTVTTGRGNSQYAMIDRYYGETSVWVSEENNVIKVDLDRVAFAITYNIEPPVDGKILVEANNSYGEGITHEVAANSKKKETKIIYSFPTGYPSHDKTKDLAHELKLKVTWKRDKDSQKEHTVEKTIEIKRNNNYILNIDMNDRLQEQYFDLELEDVQMAENQITIN